MATTFTTTQECYNRCYKGTCSTTSFPTVAMVETFRDEAYSDIVNVIGVVSDIRNTAAKIERQIVQQKIFSLKPDKRFIHGQDKLIKKQKDELDAVFLTDELGETEGFSFQPGAGI